MPEVIADSQKEEIKRLRTCHSLWTKYAPEWSLYLGAYEGGPDFANTQNIFRHFRENPEDFIDRAKRLHYINYCEQIVEFFTNFIFSETIDRNPDSSIAPWYNEFIRDVDKRGSSVDTYMRNVSDESQIFGMCYTIVEAPVPSTSDGALTKQQELDEGMSPYWVIVRPDEIIDWVVDDFDQFDYAKRKQLVNVVLAGTSNIRTLERYTEFYPDRIVQTDIDITDASKPNLLPAIKLDNTLNKVPIVIHRYKRSKRYSHMGNSFIRDFAYNNREIMNLTSLLQEFLYRQCFNILAKEVDGGGVPLNTADAGILGTDNSIDYPKGANAPSYLSPPAEPAKFLQEERQRIKEEMFSRASQDSMKELYNGGGASGFSQAQSFSKTVPFISSRADVLESAETQLMLLTCERAGKDWAESRIKYKDRYELTNVADAMTQFLILTRDILLPSETFDKAQLKRFVKEFDGKLPPETLQKVMTEIDAMDYTTWKKVQEDALLGTPPVPNDGNSPGEQNQSKSTGTLAEVKAESKTPNVKATKKPK